MTLKKQLTYRLLILAFCAAVVSSCGSEPEKENTPPAKTDMVRYPEKAEMKLLTDRPPQLETPQEILKQDITPNEYFFVRWHLSQLVTRIDIDTFRLRIRGAVAQPLELSMNDLKTKFPADSTIALCICSGNSRSSFVPKVPGSQWRNGAMGNAKWKGVRLSNLLAAAGLKKDALDVAFRGMDKGAMPGVADFVRSLNVNHATAGEVLVAYEMNGQPIPMLNGFPLKLVVPGWYASYWVGALGSIEVHTEKYKGFWMEKAYQVTSTPGMTEKPGSLAKETVPLTTINLHSVFVSPVADEVIPVGKQYTIDGLAFNDGSGISKVEVSADNGKTWTAATLNPELGKYSWRRWKYSWTPPATGTYTLWAKATDTKGLTQPEQQWNRNGYARGFIERITVQVK
ncbi:MAG: molybdopterin-dependent oxidoreductase [Taibaiella sp.]|nr:molybdopterin-dependent oxidoreductase [Taibaiella sp.]